MFSPNLSPQMERGEYQQESVLKQLEVLQEEDKEYQHIKVGARSRQAGVRPSGRGLLHSLHSFYHSHTSFILSRHLGTKVTP